MVVQCIFKAIVIYSTNHRYIRIYDNLFRSESTHLDILIRIVLLCVITLVFYMKIMSTCRIELYHSRDFVEHLPYSHLDTSVCSLPCIRMSLQ